MRNVTRTAPAWASAWCVHVPSSVRVPAPRRTQANWNLGPEAYPVQPDVIVNASRGRSPQAFPAAYATLLEMLHGTVCAVPEWVLAGWNSDGPVRSAIDVAVPTLIETLVPEPTSPRVWYGARCAVIGLPPIAHSCAAGQRVDGCPTVEIAGERRDVTASDAEAAATTHAAASRNRRRRVRRFASAMSGSTVSGTWGRCKTIELVWIVPARPSTRGSYPAL
jgi:hypothetical protein